MQTCKYSWMTCQSTDYYLLWWNFSTFSCKTNIYPNACIDPFFFFFFFWPSMASLMVQLKRWQGTGWEREGEWHAHESNQVRCSEDKASAHGTPARPTELNGDPHRPILVLLDLQHLSLLERLHLVKKVNVCANRRSSLPQKTERFEHFKHQNSIYSMIYPPQRSQNPV